MAVKHRTARPKKFKPTPPRKKTTYRKRRTAVQTSALRSSPATSGPQNVVLTAEGFAKITKFIDDVHQLEMQHWDITPLVVVLHQALGAGDSAPWPADFEPYIERPGAVVHGLEHLFTQLRAFENHFDALTSPQLSETYLRENGFLLSPPAQPQSSDAGKSLKEGDRQ
ncbi:MAG: hypothetical protein ACYDA9_14115 [Terriglobia bacterium]